MEFSILGHISNCICTFMFIHKDGEEGREEGKERKNEREGGKEEGRRLCVWSVFPGVVEDNLLHWAAWEMASFTN